MLGEGGPGEEFCRAGVYRIASQGRMGTVCSSPVTYHRTPHIFHNET